MNIILLNVFNEIITLKSAEITIKIKIIIYNINMNVKIS